MRTCRRSSTASRCRRRCLVSRPRMRPPHRRLHHGCVRLRRIAPRSGAPCRRCRARPRRVRSRHRSPPPLRDRLHPTARYRSLRTCRYSSIVRCRRHRIRCRVRRRLRRQHLSVRPRQARSQLRSPLPDHDHHRPCHRRLPPLPSSLSQSSRQSWSSRESRTCRSQAPSRSDAHCSRHRRPAHRMLRKRVKHPRPRRSSIAWVTSVTRRIPRHWIPHDVAMHPAPARLLCQRYRLRFRRYRLLPRHEPRHRCPSRNRCPQRAVRRSPVVARVSSVVRAPHREVVRWSHHRAHPVSRSSERSRHLP